MPRPVHITTPRSSVEELIKQSGIPKARRKQLDAIFEAARKRFASELRNSSNASAEAGEMQESASAAR